MARIFHGWAIVAGAFCILCVAYGTQFSFGIFFAAMLEEFGWKRGSLSGVFALYTTVYCLFALPAGRWTDRWGPRPVIAFGGLALGAALAGMSLVTRLWQPYVLYGLVAAVGMGTAFVSCNATVVRWFVRRRGLAVGIAASGASVGTIALPPLAQLLVAAAGWRTAYVLFGVAMVVVLNLAGRVMKRDPESMGLHPDGLSSLATPSSVSGESYSLRQALRTGAFWMLVATFTPAWFTIFIPAVHLASFVRDLGFPPLTAASTVSVLGAGALIGRFLMGLTSDSLGRKPVLAIAIALQGLMYLGFAGVGSLPMLMATAFGFGFAYAGNSVVFPAMVADFFGRQHVGALVGFIFAITGLFAGLGPLAAGAIHDATGSYRPAFALAAAANFLAVVILGMARPPR